MAEKRNEEPMVSVPLSIARLINGAFLPSNPNKCRTATEEVKRAAKHFKKAIFDAEASSHG